MLIPKWQIAALTGWTGIDELTIQRWYCGKVVRKATHAVLFDAVREHNFVSPPHLHRHRPTAIMKAVRARTSTK